MFFALLRYECRRMKAFLLHVSNFHEPSALAERVAKGKRNLDKHSVNNSEYERVDNKDLKIHNMKVVTA